MGTDSAYSYQIRYKTGKYLSHADALSRLPCPETTLHDGLTGHSVMLLNHLDATSVSANDIKKWTNQDPTLSCVRHFVEAGWPENAEELDKEFHPYFSKKEEFSVLNGCVLRGCRVVVPPPSRQLVLQELHDTHIGIVKMESLARSFV